jgi:hypothetical protein
MTIGCDCDGPCSAAEFQDEDLGEILLPIGYCRREMIGAPGGLRYLLGSSAALLLLLLPKAAAEEDDPSSSLTFSASPAATPSLETVPALRPAANEDRSNSKDDIWLPSSLKIAGGGVVSRGSGSSPVHVGERREEEEAEAASLARAL